MSSDVVSYVLEGQTAIVQLDDSKANALSQPVIEALEAAIARAETEARAMVLVGRADRFCAGFDLRVMMASPEAATTLLRAGAGMLMKLYGAAVPLVVACTGHALAAGALAVLTGDLRIGAAGAYKIGLNEVAIGLPVPRLAMELARDRLSKRALVDATLLARIYDPEGALAVGYLDAVVPAADVLGRAKEEAARLGKLAPAAFRATKTRLRGATIEHILSTLDADMRAILAPS